MASEESITINIHVAHGNITGDLWGSIQILNSEWKDSKGRLWTEPSPGKKKKKWVDVQTILSKLAVFEKPAYLIFCRTNQVLVDATYKNRNVPNSHESMSPIPVIEGKEYFYLEMHGKYTGEVFDALPEYYTRPKTFYFRAPPGKNCSQYGPAYGYIPYDHAMSCFMSGVKSDTNPTNDLLQLDDMNIMLRDYSDSKEVCDMNSLKKSHTLAGTFTNEGRYTKRQAVNGLASKENASPVDEGHSKKGGTVKRKRRKRKTRKR